jgi:tRNA (pseudouridine54-N1)-methyltransferase
MKAKPLLRQWTLLAAIVVWHATTTAMTTSAGRPRRRRNIVVVSRDVSSDVASGVFEANQLLAGRVDVLARCVNSAIWISNGIRTDTRVYLMLHPHNVTVRVDGSAIEELHPDERSTALLLQRCLVLGTSIHTPFPLLQTPPPPPPANGEPSLSRRKQVAERKEREKSTRRVNRSLSRESSPAGFTYLAGDTLAGRLEELSAESSGSDGVIWMLDEGGAPLWTESDRGTEDDATTLVIGDQLGYAAQDEQLLAARGDVRRVALGPHSLLTSQCIIIAHHHLDTRGTRFERPHS